MKLSYREVFQLANRCLASAGLSKGTAKANAKAIWWAELYRDCGLTALHRIVEEFSTLDPSELSLVDQSSFFSIVDSGEQPSIVSSTAALDLSCSHAKQEGIGITYATVPESDSSFPTIGHTAYQAANRGMVSVVLTEYPDGSGSFIGVPGSSHPAVAETDLEGPPLSYTKLVGVMDNDLYYRRHSPLVQAFFDVDQGDRSATDGATLKQLLEGTMEADPEGVDSDERGFFTICVDPSNPRNSAEIRRVANRFVDDRADQLTNVHRPSEIGDRAQTLIEKGVDVEKRVWEELFEFSNGIFSPDSLGSESGAGPSLER